MRLSKLVRVGTCLSAFALLGAQAGCARQAPATPQADPGYSTLIFANESPAQAEVWAVARDVDTRRIGTVMAGETSTLRVPDDFAAQSQIGFYAKVRGTSATPMTETYAFHAGDQIRVRLERDARKLSRVQ